MKDDYVVLKGDCLHKLALSVNKMLNDGYKLAGGVAVEVDPRESEYSGIWYIQALVKANQ